MDYTPTFAVKATGMKRREFLKFGLGAGAAVGAGSLLSHPLISQALAQGKREITIAIGTEITSMWPHAYSTTTGGAIAMDAMFDKPTYIGSCVGNAPATLAAGLAESWEFKGKEWIIKIRKGVKFHNGEDLTAAAVAESLNDAKAPKSRTKQPLRLVASAEAIDAYTVRLVTRRPLAQQMWGLTTVPIVSPMAKKKYGAEITKHAVGTGLYRQVEWIRGERLVMEQVRDWWGFKVDSDVPFNRKNNIERITWRTISEPIALLTALESGEVDVAQYILPQEVDRMRKKGAIKISEVKHTWNGLLIMNQNFKPFDDVRVRKAINYGINWDHINKQLLQGKEDNSYGPLLPGQVGYDGTLKPYPYDPEKARALLREAGHSKGLNIEITAAPSGSELKRVEICEAMVPQLKEVGINLKVNAVNFGYYLAKFLRKKLPFFIFAIKSEPDPWLYILFLLYSKGTDLSQYKNPKVDALFEQAMATVDDTARGKLYKQIMAMVREDAVLVWRSALNDFRGTRNDIEYSPRCLDIFLRPQLMAKKA